MPQPFNNFPMQELGMFTTQQFRQEAIKLDANEKIGDLAHFLVQNFREELSSNEHVIDTAIRLLSATKPNEIEPDRFPETLTEGQLKYYNEVSGSLKRAYEEKMWLLRQKIMSDKDGG